MSRGPRSGPPRRLAFVRCSFEDEAMEPELPEPVAAAVEKLRRSRRGLGPFVDGQLEKWRSGDAAQKARVETILLELAKPNRVGRFFGLVFGSIALALAIHFYQEVELERKVERGVPAVAKVLRHAEGFCVFGSKKHSCVELTLEVRPASARSFRASVTRSLPDRWLSRVQPGAWVRVALDAEEPGKVYLDEAAFEGPPPSLEFDKTF